MRRLVALQVGQFALAGLIALAIVGVATSIASRRVGEREAIADARITTVVRAQGTVAPVLTDALLTGDPTAIASVDAVVRADVLDDDLVRVKLWTADGQVVYSDAAALIGTTFGLESEETESLTAGRIEAEVSDLTRPENRYERDQGKLLEVYLPVQTPGGTPLLFEAYYRYRLVSSNGDRLWRSFAPISLGALVMLELVQLPLAWSLARRLRQRSREREGLLQRAIDASEVERRQLASDLHDGVVQDLTGVALALAAAERRGVGDPVVEESAEAVRGSIRSLRSLLVDIYPPDFSSTTLDSALADLVARATERGVDATLDASALVDPLPDTVARLLFRVAQEAVRNVVEHSGASTVVVRVGVAFVEVVDDGRGFDPGAVTDGHLGLTALRGLVGDAGGTLTVESSPAGTTLRASVPLR